MVDNHPTLVTSLNCHLQFSCAYSDLDDYVCTEDVQSNEDFAGDNTNYEYLSNESLRIDE